MMASILAFVKGLFAKTESDISTLSNKIAKLDTSTAYAGSQDVDTYTTTGSYHIGATADSSPTGAVSYGILVVFSHSGTIAQVFFSTTNYAYFRVKANSTTAWSSWRAISYT